MVAQQVDWLSKALDMFPELEERFERADVSPMGIWIELNLALEESYRTHPVNEDLIGRIYDYASWCFNQSETNSAETDLGSAVSVCFIEHLPVNPKVAGDLYRWMSVESFNGFESPFRYFLSEEQYLAFRNDFMSKKRTYSALSRL